MFYAYSFYGHITPFSGTGVGGNDFTQREGFFLLLHNIAVDYGVELPDIYL